LSTGSSTRGKVLVLVGPTASGKTHLLAELSSAKPDRHGIPPLVVISADSMQAYRGLDIGTAKPGPDVTERLPHELIDICEPSEQYTAGDFARLADEACARAWGLGSLPVVSGGTGFYVRGFICGLPGGPAAEPAQRERVARDLAERGSAALRAELAALDPASAGRIHECDDYRLTRALEIVRSTGRPMADFAPPSAPRKGIDFLVLGLERPREELYARIDERVEAMFAAGLAEEVARLRAAGCGPDTPAMKAIGYREFFAREFFGPAAQGSLDAVKAAVKLDTRRYAKRQMTYFRALPGIRWIGPDSGLLAGLIREFLASPGMAGGIAHRSDRGV
jgi:tRNA dimethylallyltransferase